MLAGREIEIAYEVHQVSPRLTRALRIAAAIQPAAGQKHVGDARPEDDRAEWRESEKPKPANSARCSAAPATRFGAVPTSVSMPLINPAKLNGHH